MARLLKAKLKAKSVNDVGSMALYSTTCIVPDFYFVLLLNSELLFDYYREYINCTVNIQINDIRQLPVVIPSSKELEDCRLLFVRAVDDKRHNYLEKLNIIERKINDIVRSLYAV